MPIITESSYQSPFLLANGHLQTCLPVFIRRVRGVSYQRERITTPDEDFLDLDWATSNPESHRLAIVAHGLEGDSKRPYVLGMVKALVRHGWDAVAWNARGCSGEPNRVLRFTHSGATEDLQTVVDHLLSTRSYSQIALIGFSLGGNLTLKYIGEREAILDHRIKAAVALSVPCDLLAGCRQLARPINRIYMRRFLATLRVKVNAMMKLFPGRIDDQGYERLRTFKDFDDRYTAPLHGFKDAEDYWARCSCRKYLNGIRVPTLLINARNDPFLAEGCFPIEEARDHSRLYLEMPAGGGHVGFMPFTGQGEYWSEARAVNFLTYSLEAAA